jgi:hypothetical protein
MLVEDAERLQDKTDALARLFQESAQSILRLAKEWLGSRSIITAEMLDPKYIVRNSTGAQAHLSGFHSHYDIVENISSLPLVSKIIQERIVQADEAILQEFTSTYLATYTMISILDGELAGNYLISLLPS